MSLFLVATLVAGAVAAQINGFQTFTSQNQNNTTLRYIANSGICETTPGVGQYSGYIDVGTNMSMWFWFFEARNSPDTAPFTLWLNGGPGCSSMVGLFQENGPCHVNEDGNTTTLNPYSWNNMSNILYIDQPIGTGFSYGTNMVNSTESAATLVWKAFQILFESQIFSKYESREFVFATESYGGRYAPLFVSYFDRQNTLITSGKIKGEPIITSVIMINDGWFDPKIQFMSYYKFAANAPGYGQLQPDGVLKNISEALYGPDGCVAQEEACYAAGDSTQSNGICRQAEDYCINDVYFPAFRGFSPYDIRQADPANFPPGYYLNYLSIPEVVKRIGAGTTYQECSQDAFSLLYETGDRARSSLAELSELVNSRLRVLLWAGDADLIANWLGVHDVTLAMEWYGKQILRDTPLSNITLDGIPIAAVANVDKFSFARIFASGHQVAAFQPAAALEIFSQVIRKEPLHSA